MKKVLCGDGAWLAVPQLLAAKAHANEQKQSEMVHRESRRQVRAKRCSSMMVDRTSCPILLGGEERGGGLAGEII